MPTKNVKLVFTVPETHADIVREAMGKAGAGKIGNYSFCSVSSKIIGRFKPEQGANPTIGEIGKLQTVNEERIEAVCSREIVKNVMQAIQKVHPYEEIGFDVYPLEDM